MLLIVYEQNDHVNKFVLENKEGSRAFCMSKECMSYLRRMLEMYVKAGVQLSKEKGL